jgi:glycosyltransferase involved in cell wall biosynthesis
LSAVTIIVPVYNTEKYLNRCIDSIIDQSFRDIEILLINDGSEDNSLNILYEYANKDDRIKIVNQENKGLSAARNVGIKLAAGEYVLHVDSDDYIKPNMCEVMYNEAKKYNADIVTSHVYFSYPNKTVIKREPYKKVCGFNDFLLLFATRRGINSVWNKLIRRNLYILNNIEHYEDISLGEDSSALLRLVVFASCIVTVDSVFYHYDIKSSSMTGNKNKRIIEYIQGLAKVEEFYMTNHIETGMFPLLRFKIAYKLLSDHVPKKMEKNNNPDYILLYECFYEEIFLILKHPMFHRLYTIEKCFIVFHAARKSILKLFVRSLWITLP